MWQPLIELPPEQINPRVHEQGFTRVFRNDRYEVLHRVAGPKMVHLSIKTLDRSPVRSWRHLQQMKNECCGEEWTGLEFFPPESKLVDTSNQYHLWCFPPEVELGIGFDEADKALVSDDQAVEEWNEGNHAGRQEPWEEGLTTGRSEASRPARERLRSLIQDGDPRIKP